MKTRRFTIITPLYSKYNKYITQCYDSFKNQDNWEWVIVENNGGKVPSTIKEDKRVIVTSLKSKKIGALKRYAAFKGTGKIIVELDADDLLTDNALSELDKTFEDSQIAMTYSNSAHFDEEWKSDGYSEYWGWKQRSFFYKGHELVEMIAFPPSSQMMRRIEWAPNHVRAWRRSAYEKLKGHDSNLKVGDDHDLCCRFYIEYGSCGVKHIDKCLYLYRKHDTNTCNVLNGEVQAQTDKNYLKYSRQLAIRDADDNRLLKLDLGGRLNAWTGFKTVDLKDADVITDLNNSWPFEDNSVGVLRASHIFEHLQNPIQVMNEAYRVLAPGGWLFIDVPSTDGRGAFQDPTHISFWNSNSFWYYTDRNYSRFTPEYKGRFQLSRVVNWYPTDFEKKHNILIVQADLIALKGQRQAGEMKI